MTIKDVANNKNVQIASIQKAIKRKGFGKYSPTEQLPDKVVAVLLNGSPKQVSTQPFLKRSKKDGATTPPTPIEKKLTKRVINEAIPNKPVNRFKKVSPFLQKMAIPLLMIPASFGVGYLASYFVPLPIAVIEAAGFEMVYLGLASISNASELKRKHINRVSIGAVLVSIIYNTISAAIHQNPELLNDLSIVWFWVVSAIHGIPLSLLAYFTIDLTIRQR